jgi:hypothetical protein
MVAPLFLRHNFFMSARNKFSAVQAFILLGGSLGAGKSSLLREFMRFAERMGLRCGLVTNDQGDGMVDTALGEQTGAGVKEVPGGCSCCRADALVGALKALGRKSRPAVYLAEPVGSCTDLMATVLRPLQEIYRMPLRVAPLAVAMDPDLLPGSRLSRACAYALRLRSELSRSLSKGVTEIDNNRCEQSIRPVALGRKNCLRPCGMPPAEGSASRSAAGRWLHVGSQGAAPAVAAIMSLVESCRRMGINARTYLDDVLPQLASAHLDKVAELAKTLTPTRWQTARVSVATAA